MTDGILVVDKPVNITSHDAVVAVRRALRTKKVGHTGTLDPIATGVLALVIGKATRLSRYLTGGEKTYRATVQLGAVTDTLDREGQILEERPVDLDPEAIDQVVYSFTGDIEQLPPMYSAKKIDGQKLYELARKGIEVEREPKTVTIYDIQIRSVDLPEIVIEVRCSAGTYLRVLAADIGRELGCGAHLKDLVRTAVGPFTLEAAHSLEDLEEAQGQARELVIPLNQALPHLPRLDLSQEQARRVLNGEALRVRDLTLKSLPEGCAVGQAVTLHHGERLVAVARLKPAALAMHKAPSHLPAVQPERVLS